MTIIQIRGGGPAAATDLLETARRYAANAQDWPFAPRFNPRRRWYQRLATEADSEIWVLSWLPGQQTDLHDHGGSAGAFVVVSGDLTEQSVTSGQRSSRSYRAGDGRTFDARHVHQITHKGIRPAVSLHVYRPALRAMTRYRLAGEQLVVTAVERAGADW
jgi:mannose-6-phosphate isomerase-like protein (cupin superfamily)